MQQDYLKISDIVKISGVPKSTIHFYIQHSLIPEGFKTSKNMKYYSKTTVEYIKILQYLQKNLNYSINDINFLYSNLEIDFKDFFIDLTKMLYILVDDLQIRKKFDLFSIIKLKKKDLIPNCKRFFYIDITKEFLEELFDEGILEKQEFYNFNDLDLIKTCLFLKNEMKDLNIIKEYIKSAKQIALIEKQISDKLVDMKEENNEVFDSIKTFDILLKIKPYIYNKETYFKYMENIKK